MIRDAALIKYSVGDVNCVENIKLTVLLRVLTARTVVSVVWWSHPLLLLVCRHIVWLQLQTSQLIPACWWQDRWQFRRFSTELKAGRPSQSRDHSYLSTEGQWPEIRHNILRELLRGVSEMLHASLDCWGDEEGSARWSQELLHSASYNIGSLSTNSLHLSCFNGF